MTVHQMPTNPDIVYHEVVMPPAALKAMLCQDCLGEPIAVVIDHLLHVVETHDTTCPVWLRMKREMQKP